MDFRDGAKRTEEAVELYLCRVRTDIVNEKRVSRF